MRRIMLLFYTSIFQSSIVSTEVSNISLPQPQIIYCTLGNIISIALRLLGFLENLCHMLTFLTRHHANHPTPIHGGAASQPDQSDGMLFKSR